MKPSKLKFLLAAGILVASLTVSADAQSQTRKLPDGTIVYPDGTKKLPNGTVVYPKGRGPVEERNRTVSLPDGTVIYPGDDRYPRERDRRDRDRRDRYPKDRNDRVYRKNDGTWMPPGQAKKVYGGSAKDYAPGQQKKGTKGHNGRKKKGR